MHLEREFRRLTRQQKRTGKIGSLKNSKTQTAVHSTGNFLSRPKHQ